MAITAYARPEDRHRSLVTGYHAHLSKPIEAGELVATVAGLLPIYLFAQSVGFLDNIWLLIILYTSMNLPIAVWMLRSFLSEVPVEILEAASVDGASLTRTLRSVVAPVVTPGIASAALICWACETTVEAAALTEPLENAVPP